MRDAQLQHLGTGGSRFAGGNDHARVRNGDADDGHNLAEDVVRNGIRKTLQRDVFRRTDARHTDGVRAYTEGRFQVFGMHEQAHEIILIRVQAEQNTQAHIVDAAFHGAVHRFGVISVVALRPCRVEGFVILLLIGLLEKDIRADAGILQLAIILHRSGCNVHIHAADGSVLVMDAIDGLYRFQNVFYRVIARVFAGFQSQTFVTHVLQGHHFAGNFLLGEFLAVDGLVLEVIRAIHAAVHAIVRQIERSEHHDAVSVEFLLDVACQLMDALYQIGFFTLQQHGGFAV